MLLLEVTGSHTRRLQDVADTIAAAKRVVVVTGAGISTNCGIPVCCCVLTTPELVLFANSIKDFRSENGQYSLIRAEHESAGSLANSAEHGKVIESCETPSKATKARHLPFMPTNIKGKNLFDAMIWKDPVSTSTFYRFIAFLRRSIREDVKQATATHRFIRRLRDRQKLVRCYTQNIDGLERREGLSADLALGKGSKSRFSRKTLSKTKAELPTLLGSVRDGGCEVVQLHGNLDVLRCTLCQKICEWNDVYHSPRFLTGKAPVCQPCVTTDQFRQDRGKRGTTVGTLRPNIVLYGEEHPFADAIGTISSHDLNMSPDLLLILGTSLHIHGLKVLVREFAKSVHAQDGGKGKVIFVNLSKPAKSVWKDVIDYWVCMDCDEWVAKMRRCRPDIWQAQGQLETRIKKIEGSKKTKEGVQRAHATKSDEEDKENIILDSEDVPSSDSPRPKVLITTPIKPKMPLQKRGLIQGIPFDISKKRAGCIIPDSQPPSSLPTPPSSNAVTPMSITGEKRKAVTEAYSEGCDDTPSKRRTSLFGIWAD